MQQPCKNNIVLCELHHYAIHGRPEKLHRDILSHWLVIDRFDSLFQTALLNGYDSDGSYWSLNEDDLTDGDGGHEDDHDNDNDDEPDESIINDMMHMHRAKYIDYINSHQFERKNHPYIRNYANIVARPHYIQPHIAQIIRIGNNALFYYSVAIIKTIWLRLVQRNWKRVFNERKRILKLRGSSKALFYRQINGKWPSYCLYYPSLSGMLQRLKPRAFRSVSLVTCSSAFASMLFE